MESDADRLDSIRALGGFSVSMKGVAFEAIFDRQYLGVSVGDLDVESRTPALTCRSCDIGNFTKDDTVNVKSASYRVLRVEPDSPAPGWSVVILRS